MKKIICEAPLKRKIEDGACKMIPHTKCANDKFYVRVSVYGDYEIICSKCGFSMRFGIVLPNFEVQ